jgi:hypothetical protein
LALFVALCSPVSCKDSEDIEYLFTIVGLKKRIESTAEVMVIQILRFVQRGVSIVLSSSSSAMEY